MLRRLLRPAPLLFAAALASPAGAADPPAQARGDQELIQGTWECVATLKDGRQVETYVGVRAALHGNRLTWTFPQPDGSTKTAKAVFTLDPKANPKHFDWSLEAEPDKVHKRLYVLAGDTLLWSTHLGDSARPESFTAGRWLFVMRRVAGADR